MAIVASSFNYPHKSQVKRMVDAVREAGMAPAIVEFAPDGTMRISEAHAKPTAPNDEFTKWESRL